KRSFYLWSNFWSGPFCSASRATDHRQGGPLHASGFGIGPGFNFVQASRVSGMVLSVMTQTLRRLGSLLFGLSEPVNRRQYAVAGFSLMAFKYVVDAGIIYASSRTLWSPLAYLTPLESARIEAVGKNTAVAVALAIWTLPFIWIGVSMT